MSERISTGVPAFAGTLIIFCILVPGLSFADAPQETRNSKPLTADSEKTTTDDPNKGLTSIDEELVAKRAIKAADKEYQENLDRARQLSVLGTSIATSFKEKNLLDREDIKKLEKVEKLAKGIRSAAGGSEDDGEMEKPPKDLCSAMATLGDLSRSLKDKVEKTPKHVISAAVIDQANVLLQLIRIIRTLPPQA